MVTLTRIGFGIIFVSAVGGVSWAAAKWHQRSLGHVYTGPSWASARSHDRSLVHVETMPTRAELELSRKLMAPTTDKQERAARAEAVGDLAGAEQLWIESNRLTPHISDYQLVELHEKMGKYKEALAGYKWELTHGENQTQILTRVGDLDLIYGSKEDARKEYMRAAEAPSEYSDKTLAPVAAGEPVGKTASLTQLRAAAYYNVGTRYRGGGPDGVARKYLELALSLEPNDGLMRFGYSFIAPDPTAEKWLAEKEATGVLKVALHRWRVEDNEIMGASNTSFIHGKAITTETPYTPKGVTKTNPNGNIFTPHVVDPVMQGRAGWIWEGNTEVNRP